MTLALTHAALLGLLGGLLVAWCRAHPERRAGVTLAVVAMAAFTAGWFLFVRSAAIPARWLTPLHEGTEAQTIRTLYGRGVHAGSNFWFLTLALADARAPQLRDVVRMNLWLAGLNALAFFAIARHVLRRWWTAALFTAAFAGNVVSLHAALSELPAQACTAYLLAGVVAAAVLDARDLPRWATAAALALLALLTALLALTRPELSSPGLLALALAVGQRAFGAARWGRGRAALLAWLRGVPDRPRWQLIAATLALVALDLGLNAVLDQQAGWIVSALNPVNLSFLTLPGELWRLWFPLGLVALVVLGVAHSLRHVERFAGLPLALLFLCRLYNVTGHGVFYEMLRYLTFVVPSALFLALFGWRELEDLARRHGWGEAWQARARLGLVALCLTPPLTGLRDHFVHGDYLAGNAPPPLPLTRNPQIEARYLVDLVDRNPACVFVARVTHADHNEGRVRGYDLVLFGRPLPAPVVRPEGGGSLEEAVATTAPAARCARAYRGLDCNLTTSDGCGALARERTLVEQRVFGTLPYNDVPEYGETGPTVALQVFAIGPP